MAASNQLPIQIVMGALPAQVAWKPQQLADAIAQRLRLVTSQSFALFVSGSTEPATNVGPWLRDGTTWYVWSDTAGGYVPQTLASESLGYWIGNAAPDPNVYSIWISTTVGGAPLAVNIFYNGAWTDVYAAVIGDYLTIAAFNTAIANYSTTTQMNAAIAAAVPNTYIAKATNMLAQSINVNNVAQKVTLDSAPINPAPGPFDTVLSRYIAPAQGNYQVNAYAQIDNNTALAADMEILWDVYVNGVFQTGSGDSTPSPNGNRWWPKVTDLFALNQNDYVEIYITARDGVNTGLIDLTDVNFSAIRIGE